MEGVNLIRNLTVRMGLDGKDVMWTGSIIATRSNPPQTIIMSCAHALHNTNNEYINTMPVRVYFYGFDHIGHHAEILSRLPESDLLVVLVNHQHTHRFLKFVDVHGNGPFMAPDEQVYCVGHAVNLKWVYHSGHIAVEFKNSDYGLAPNYEDNLTVYGHNMGTSRGCSGAAIINNRCEILGMQISCHGTTLNLHGANPIPTFDRNVAQQEEAHQAYLKSHTITSLNFEAYNNILIPLSNLSFATTITYIDTKIRELIPGHNNLPLNDVVANHLFRY